MNATKNRLHFLFLTAVISILGVSYFIISSGFYVSNRSVFSLAITVDICLLIPALYFFLIRKRKVSKITLIPVIILSYTLASFLLPADGQSYLKIIKFLLAPLELLAVGYLIYKVRKVTLEHRSNARNSKDFMVNLRKSLYTTFGENKAADIMATEVSFFYYAFFGWGKTKEMGNEQAFTYHKTCGYSWVVGVFFFLILLETFSLHLLISQWSITAAWILSALSVYSLVFLFADFNAAKKRPILVLEDHLNIRIGLRWWVNIPFDQILYIEKGYAWKDKKEGYVNASLMGSENIMIILKEPMKMKGFYGISKNVTKLALSIDNKDEFYTLIQKKMEK